jgi:hypothetical protein
MDHATALEQVKQDVQNFSGWKRFFGYLPLVHHGLSPLKRVASCLVPGYFPRLRNEGLNQMGLMDPNAGFRGCGPVGTWMHTGPFTRVRANIFPYYSQCNRNFAARGQESIQIQQFNRNCRPGNEVPLPEPDPKVKNFYYRYLETKFSGVGKTVVNTAIWYPIVLKTVRFVANKVCSKSPGWVVPVCFWGTIGLVAKINSYVANRLFEKRCQAGLFVV